MNSFRISFLVVVLATSQIFAGHPHHRMDDEVDMIDTFQKNWSPSRIQEIQSYVRNQIGRKTSKLVERLPMASNVLGMTKEDLMRFPLDPAMKSLSEVCHTAIITDSFNPTYTPQMNEINMRFMSDDYSKDVTVSLEEVESFLSNPSLNLDNGRTVMYITSWKSNVNNPNDSMRVLRNAFKCRGIENFIVINIGDFIDNYHALQTLNTEMVGTWIGDALLQMKERLPVSRLYLIGHGVGAHVAGATGRRFTEMTGNLLPRITGLDPAMLCYKNPTKVVELQRGDAEFVDIIHSNSYGLGNPVPMGDVDFYPNERRVNTPGCDNVLCAHEMAVRYFAESVLPGYERNFMARRSSPNSNPFMRQSRLSANYGERVPNYTQSLGNYEQVPMGYSTPKNIKGIYYLETNPQYPYGKNVQTDSAPKCVSTSSSSERW